MSALTDIRVALRALRSRPAYALISIVTLMLIVGAGSSVFAVINATFIKPLPFVGESRLMWFSELPPGAANVPRGTPLHSPAFVTMRERLRSVESLAGIYSRESALTVDGESQPINRSGVTADYFQVLGVPLSAGRMFTDAEDLANARLAVVSERFARAQLGSPAPMGAHVVMDGEPFEIIGVLPALDEGQFLGADIFTPLNINAGNLPVPTATIIQGIGRLRPGATAEQARSEAAAIMASVIVESSAGPAYKGWSASAVRVREGLFGNTRPALTLLFLAICLLTAIACANLANVTLAEMSGRRDEITLRTALGAKRSQLVRLIAIEHLMVAVAGGVAGLVLARVLLPAILSLDARTAASLGVVAIDWRVELGAIALSLIVSVLSGVLPALDATRGDLASGLAQSSRRTAGSRRQARARGSLVAIESMVATVLLITSALLLTAFGRTAALKPGFDPANAFGTQVRLPVARYPGHAERAAFVKRVVDELRAVPGVVSASAAFSTFQAGGGYILSVIPEGRTTSDGQPRTVQFRRASPGYFQTMKIPELKGRTFADTDTAESPLVAVISKLLAEQFWPGEDPLGRRIARASDPSHPLTIVGVVEDVRDRGLEQLPAPTIYLAYSQNTNAAAPISLVVRTAGDSGSYRRSVTEAVHRVDPLLPLSGTTSLDEFLSASVGPGRFRSVLLLAFAIVGVVLAAVGIYGVTSRGVGERTRELGIRLALGSGRGALWRLVLRQALGAVAIGIAIGIPVAVFASIAISKSVAGTSLSDLWTAMPSVAVLAVVGGLAAAVPTLRAMHVDVVAALRAD